MTAVVGIYSRRKLCTTSCLLTLHVCLTSQKPTTPYFMLFWQFSSARCCLHSGPLAQKRVIAFTPHVRMSFRFLLWNNSDRTVPCVWRRWGNNCSPTFSSNLVQLQLLCLAICLPLNHRHLLQLSPLPPHRYLHQWSPLLRPRLPSPNQFSLWCWNLLWDRWLTRSTVRCLRPWGVYSTSPRTKKATLYRRQTKTRCLNCLSLCRVRIPRMG